MHVLRNVIADVAHAVNAVPDPDAVGERFDVNIAGPAIDRLGNDQVDQSDDGRVAVLHFRARRRVELVLRGFLVDAGHRLGQYVACRIDELVDVPFHLPRGRQRRDDLPIKPEPEQILRFEIKRISDDDFESIPILLER